MGEMEKRRMRETGRKKISRKEEKEGEIKKGREG